MEFSREIEKFRATAIHVSAFSADPGVIAAVATAALPPAGSVAVRVKGGSYSENTECTVSYIHIGCDILGLEKTFTMTPIQPREIISFQLLESLKGSLQSLEDLRLVPHNDPHVLRLKQHLRQKIAQIEGRLAEMYSEVPV